MNYAHYSHCPYEIPWKECIDENTYIVKEKCMRLSENAWWMHEMVCVHVREEYVHITKEK